MFFPFEGSSTPIVPSSSLIAPSSAGRMLVEPPPTALAAEPAETGNEMIAGYVEEDDSGTAVDDD